MAQHRIYDLVVIGGGAGGLVVASVAGQLGLEVALVERGPALGGDCLHTGCVPSKTLIHSARLAWQMRHAPRWGLPACEAGVDFAQVRARIQAVVETIQRHDDPERFRAYGVDVRFGAARFVSPHEIEVAGQRLRGRRFVIATGSRPRIPDVPGLDEAGFLTNENVFSLETLPRRLVVVGGGPVGLELAQAFARLGSEVVVVTRSGRLLPKDDADLVARLRAHLAGEGLRFLRAPRLLRVETGDAGKQLVYEDEAGMARALPLDEILIATGRLPNVEGLGLEAAGVRLGPDGIEVDRRQRTSRRHIYACGDVCGPHRFTHMAEHQAGVVIANAVFRIPKRVDDRTVPWVTYTDPELAQVGPTLARARAEGRKVQALDFPFADNDRAQTAGETAGLVRLVVEGKRVVGASILGPQAGELIHEIALGIRLKARVADIAATIHAYPTLAQAIKRAAHRYYAPRLFSARSRRLVRLLRHLPD